MPLFFKVKTKLEKLDNWIIKEIINRNFEWEDLSAKYQNIDQLNNNVFCPFHNHNYTEGNAKFYYDEEEDIWSLYCFVEKRVFHVYDYVNLILCKNYQKYKSPLEFLKSNMPNDTLTEQINNVKRQQTELKESLYKKRATYISNIAVKYNNIEDYIEELYTEKVT